MGQDEAAARGVPAALDRTELYDKMYTEHGYNQHGVTHSRPIIHGPLLRAYPKATRGQYEKNVLDVGCSYGVAVQMLWTLGFCASGTDLSSVPIAHNNAMIKMPQPVLDKCGPLPRFKQGSAAALPWPSAHFHAIISTDVMEHVPSELVPAVATEFTRVAREYLMLNIATQPDWTERQIGTGKMNGTFLKMHENVHGVKWWRDQFEATGAWFCTAPFTKKRGPPTWPGEAVGQDERGNYISEMRLLCKRRSATRP